MAVTTVAQLAAELNRPAATLLDQLQSAGVPKATPDDMLTEADKERLAEAPAHGLPVIYFEKSSKGAVAYLHLAAEMIKKSKVKKGSNA